MNRIRTVFIACLLASSPAGATWSVITVDSASSVVVIASATCVPQERFATFPATGLKDIQAIVFPGIGVAAAQASVDRTRANQKLIFSELGKVKGLYLQHGERERSRRHHESGSSAQPAQRPSP